jgi:hypothetical protein
MFSLSISGRLSLLVRAFLKTVLPNTFEITIPDSIGPYHFAQVLSEGAYSVICL